jgi:hypothetical protein
VRVLHGDAELAAAAERAAESQRRLQARLEARAARDAWMAQRKEAEDQVEQRASSPHTPAA